jgi:hypothetical protein
VEAWSSGGQERSDGGISSGGQERSDGGELNDWPN